MSNIGEKTSYFNKKHPKLGVFWSDNFLIPEERVRLPLALYCR